MKKTGRKKMEKITRRWVFGTLLWIVVVLIFAEVLAVTFVRRSYYSNAEQAIDYRIKTFSDDLPALTLDVDTRAAQLRTYVAEFPEKNKFEVMLINQSGFVTTTSSGFPVEDALRPEDYVLATAAADGMGTHIGETSLGEPYLAVTKLLTTPIGDVSAIRFVTSLERTNTQLQNITVAISAAVLCIIGFVLLSGMFFIRSIVNPLGKIGDSAQDIASGNFDIRLAIDRDDEVGELCERINEMAAGLSRADKMKNDFISSVSHELRTPLTSIKGWGETLMSMGQADTETFNNGMRIILSETTRLSSMVEDLLDFSRIQSGTFTMNMRPIDLVAELTDAILTVEQRANREGISISYEEPAFAVPIMGDPDRLRQVFGNVLDNAIKYSPKESAITVAVLRNDTGAVVTIADNGIGIPEQDLPNVTQRFYKASNSTTGSGIGLAVVSEIMQAHGGSLDIESKLARGTRIILKFKLLNEKGHAHEQQTLF